MLLFKPHTQEVFEWILNLPMHHERNWLIPCGGVTSQASGKTKKLILSEFIASTGYHPKYAVHPSKSADACLIRNSNPCLISGTLPSRSHGAASYLEGKTGVQARSNKEATRQQCRLLRLAGNTAPRNDSRKINNEPG